MTLSNSHSSTFYIRNGILTNKFPSTLMSLAAVGWWTLWSLWFLKRFPFLLRTTEKARDPQLWRVLPDALNTLRGFNLNSSDLNSSDLNSFHPRSLNKGRRLGRSVLSCTINKICCTPAKYF